MVCYRPCLCRLFQSTHLKRGATVKFSQRVAACLFQSTHLKRGATSSIDAASVRIHFNPRTSNEVRLETEETITDEIISIHAPQTRCDLAEM